jgi:hypothetical protein
MDYSACDPESQLPSTPSVTWFPLSPFLAAAGSPSKATRLCYTAGQLYSKPQMISIGLQPDPTFRHSQIPKWLPLLWNHFPQGLVIECDFHDNLLPPHGVSIADTK